MTKNLLSIKQTLLLFAFTLLSATVFSQVTTSSIGGLVTDDAGQPLIGATVHAVHTPSGTEYGAAVNVDGRYAIRGMRTGGPYTVTISYVGYTTSATEGISLRLGDSYTHTVKLSEGIEMDNIVVTSSAGDRFNNAKTGAGSSFSSDAIESVPSVSRSVSDIVALSPLVGKDGSQLSIAGSNNRYNSFQIDGAVSNDVFGLSSSGTNGGSTGSNPVSLDAIEEIQVVVAPFDVRQGGFTGGGINAVTKSGTNIFKGSAYAYYNNQNFYGSTAGTLAEGQERIKADEQMTRIFGATAGGALVKDKLFAFVSLENTKTIEPVSYYPGYASNYISEDVAQQIINKYSSITGNTEEFGMRNTATESFDLMARVDYNINKKHKLMLRYQLKNAYDDKYSASQATYTFNNSSYRLDNLTNSVVAELNSRFTDDISNEMRVTYNRVRDFRSVNYMGPYVRINNVLGADEATGNTVYIGTDRNSGANAVNQDVVTFTNNTSIYKGNHTITAGTHNELYLIGNTYIQNSTGYYIYNSLEDFLDGGEGKATQYHYNYAANGTNAEFMPTLNALQLGFYIQDEWKPNNDFTLTAGLRADIPILLNDPATNEAFNSSDIANNGEHVIGRMPSTKILWSPRVGFRYFIDSEHRSLLRGGAGIFTGRVPFVWLHNAFTNNGVDMISTSMYSSSSTTPALSATPTTSGTAGSQTVNVIDENFKYPQVFRANLAFEQTFRRGWKVTLEGVYSKTLNNIAFTNLALTDNGKKVFFVSEDAANENNTSTYYDLDSGDYAAVINLENTSKGYTYNLSAMVEKSFDFGLNLMASYTFGHAYSVNDGTSSVANSNWSGNYSINSNDMSEIGFSKYDVPHRLKASVSYNSPMYAKGRMNTVVGVVYNGSSGSRYHYAINENWKNVNGDNAAYNQLLYIPTAAEVELMSWSSATDKANFIDWVENDNYASSHRGQFAERYGLKTPFEHHFDLHIAQNFIYNRQKNSRIELSLDIMNFTNLLNREWGMYNYVNYSAYYPLKVTSLTASDGGYTPTYAFDTTATELLQSDFSSRWYMQIGARVTF
ncbi:MAG: carboxypeptidase regulatory-like domain-containing protein [Rikenellaceae bacterium]